MTFDTIEDAFDFVGGAPPGERTAVVHRKTGESFYASFMSDFDELPEDVDDNDDYIDIPHKNELGLGRPLVAEFVQERCPDLIEAVLRIFRHSGAYGRFKNLLAGKNLLEVWYAFERQRPREALLQWCGENGIVLE